MRSLSTTFPLVFNDLLESLKINYVVSSLKILPFEYVFWPPDAILICFVLKYLWWFFKNLSGRTPIPPLFWRVVHTLGALKVILVPSPEVLHTSKGPSASTAYRLSRMLIRFCSFSCNNMFYSSYINVCHSL